MENHKLDNKLQVFFYEQDYYFLSNFSSFTMMWDGKRFDTSEAVYHYEKFKRYPNLQEAIRTANSAHEAFKLAQVLSSYVDDTWSVIKLHVMRKILVEKTRQHPYVMRKLLETGDRDLIEDSWRDDFWGWGPDKDGKNMLGELWMEIRKELS